MSILVIFKRRGRKKNYVYSLHVFAVGIPSGVQISAISAFKNNMFNKYKGDSTPNCKG